VRLHASVLVVCLRFSQKTSKKKTGRHEPPFPTAPDNAASAASMVQAISEPEAPAFLFACAFNVPCAAALSTTCRESCSLK